MPVIPNYVLSADLDNVMHTNTEQFVTALLFYFKMDCFLI